MRSPPTSKRSVLPQLATHDQANFLSGALSPTRVSELEVNGTVIDDDEKAQEEWNFDVRNGSSIDAPAHKQNGFTKDSSSESEDIEDYDKQQMEISAINSNGRVGDSNPDLKDDLENEEIAQLAKVTSIPIKLMKTETKGRYLLTADDPEIRDIIRRGLQREKNSMSHSKSHSVRFRDLVFTRRFTTFDRFNPAREASPFHGFFTLFWIGTGFLILRVSALNWRAYGNIFGHNEIIKDMFGRDLVVMAVTDGVLYASMAFTFILQLLVSKHYVDWNRSGWIIQQVWQTLCLGCVVGWIFYRNWPWSHTIFILLHSFIFLMKQHSFAAYNGYLSQVYKRKLALERKARQLDDISPISSPISSHSEARSSSLANADDNVKSEDAFASRLRDRKRRASPKPMKRSKSGPIVNLATESSEIAAVAEKISSGVNLEAPELDYIKEILGAELETLNNELKGKCSATRNYYPDNLTLANFLEWTVLPTVVYELEYPRQDHISWSYVAEKTAATFGVIAIMQVISQAYMYPIVMETIRMKEAGLNVHDRWQEFPWVILDMLFPLMLEQLLSWYLIWECILNVLAELTRFADRGFYGDWWNSVSFSEYARDWNKPVHNFLLRHVYHSSISALHVSKTTAMLITFLLSACIHELVMFCLFKKLRGYLFLMQLLQLPLAALSRTKMLKDRKVFGNIVFWFSIFVGPSMIACLYLIV